MKLFEEDRQKKIYKIVSIVKLLSLFLGSLIILNRYYFSKENQHTAYSAMTGMLLISIGIAAVYLINTLRIFKSKKNGVQGKIKIKDIVEVTVFIGIFSILIIVSGGHLSQYKFMFLFIIISSTIQFEMLFGMVIAAVCSTFVLTLDLLALPSDIINHYFEIDLILVGIFILTAWLLGDYGRIEKNYREQLAKLANVDELTGLYNHRFFQDALSKHVKLSQKLNVPVCLLFMDIDYFKYYNDLYGHQAGDHILSKIGFLLNKNLRPQDIAARYGGDELAVILPDTSEEQSLAIAEKIRSEVENTRFAGEEAQPNGQITVSIGVSCLPDKAKSKKELINSSDDALYRAKFFNKNRVETYYSVLEELKAEIDDRHIDLISSIKTLISVVNAKDRYTYGHVERVVILCDLVSEKIGLTEQERKILKYGAYLHDIGKIEVPQEVLNKKMPLTDEEWDMLKQHPATGAEIIKPVDSLREVLPLILYHHERYDGKGYPNQLKGESIPYLVRILTVADSFDAMTSDRPYKHGKTYDEAIIELKKCRGSQFDPDITDTFIEVIQNNKDYFEHYK